MNNIGITSNIFKRKNSVFLYRRLSIIEEITREYNEDIEIYINRVSSKIDFQFAYNQYDRSLITMLIPLNIYEELASKCDLWESVERHFKIDAILIILRQDESLPTSIGKNG